MSGTALAQAPSKRVSAGVIGSGGRGTSVDVYVEKPLCQTPEQGVELVDTPDTVVVSAEYPEGFLGVFSINYAAMRYQSRNGQLNQLDGDKARMDGGRGEFRVYMAGAEDTEAQHRRPTAPMALGFQAALATLLANLSLRHGNGLARDRTLCSLQQASLHADDRGLAPAVWPCLSGEPGARSSE